MPSLLIRTELATILAVVYNLYIIAIFEIFSEIFIKFSVSYSLK